MGKKTKFLILGVLALMVAAPLFALSAGLVPCGDKGEPPCTLCSLFDLAQSIINWLTTIVAPAIAVLAFTVGGFKILMSGPNPGLRAEGIKAIRNGAIGLLIVFGSWIIVNELLLFAVGGTGTAKVTSFAPWSEITCIPPVTPEPEPTIAAPLTFNNVSSPELITFTNCVKAAVPSLRITSTTDSNIALGSCKPTSPYAIFNNPQHCQHTKNSCHYGGTNPTCIAKGSYAFDFGTQSWDPSYATVAAAVTTCNPGAFVQNEGTHGHASIGAIYGCGCN